MGAIVFLDANIFLEVALENDKQIACERILQRVMAGTLIAHTSDFILYSCLLQLFNKTKDLSKMNNFLISINSIPLKIIRPSFAELSGAIVLMQETKLDFDDALVVSCMQRHDIPQLISSDKDFNKVNLIECIDPITFT